MILQFGHESEGSRRVLAERIPRTLQKNQRLARSLQSGMERILVRRESGVLVERLGIRLTTRDLADFHTWFCMVTRGFYHYETGTVLPVDHDLFLIRPVSSEQARTLLGTIQRVLGHKQRSLAGGEFKYAFAVGRQERLSAWYYAFKSVDMYAVTLGPDCPSVLREQIEAIAWKPAVET